MAVTQYIGSRYVPLFAEPIEWSSANTYEPLTIVIHEGNSYTSRQAVPKGIDISDEKFWALTGNYNAQVELYRRETAAAKDAADDAQADATAAQTDIDTLLPKADFDAENTVKKYIDDSSTQISNVLPIEDFSTDNTVKKYVDTMAGAVANPVFYGADPTGENDSSAAIQACFDANVNGTVVFTRGKYRIDNPIEIDFGWTRGLIDFNGATLVNDTVNGFAFGIGTKNVNLDSEGKHGEETLFIKNFILESASNYAVSVERWFMNCHVESFSIITTKNGIQLGRTHSGYANKPIDALVNDFMIRSKSPIDSGYFGIAIVGTDAKITNGRIYGFKHCIEGNGYLTQIHNVHFLLINANDWASIDTNYCCVYNPGVLQATECYCDTYPCFARARKGSPMGVCVANLYVFAYHALSYGVLFDFTEYSQDFALDVGGIISLTGLSFYPNNYPLSAKIVGIPEIPIGVNPGTFYKGFLRDSAPEYSCTHNLSYYDFAKPRDHYSPKYWPAFKPIGSMVMLGTLFAPSNSIDTLIVENNNGKFVFELNVNARGELASLTYVDALSQKRFNTAAPKLGLWRVNNSRMYEVYFTDDTFSVNTNLHVDYVSTMNHIFAPVNHETDAIISTEEMTYISTSA